MELMENLPPWTFFPCLKWLGGCSQFFRAELFALAIMLTKITTIYRIEVIEKFLTCTLW